MKKNFTLLFVFSITLFSSITGNAQCPIMEATPYTQTICSGDTTNITLSSDIPGTTYSWSRISSGVSGATNGSGNVINQTLTTTDNNQGQVDYIITPTANSCTGNPVYVTVYVNPAPEIFGAPSGSICSGNSTYISLNASFPGTTFSWTVVQTNVTGASSGTGNTINQILYATGAANGNVVYTVTPSANGCQGYPLDILVNVNPLPNPTITEGIICVDLATGNSFTIHTLDTGLSNSGYDFVWYFNGAVISGAVNNTYEANQSGIYGVRVTDNTTGCISSLVYANVYESYPAYAMNLSQYVETNGSTTVTVYVTGGNGAFLYQLDGGAFQSSNVFYNVPSGSHEFHVIDTNGCTDLTMTTDVLSNNEFNTISLVYNPNPVTDVLTITAKETLKKVTVFNTLGQIVYSKLFDDLNPQIELSNLVSGNYFVKVEADNKQNVFKIIKK